MTNLTADVLLVKGGEKHPTIVHIRRSLQCKHDDCRESPGLAEACFRESQRTAALTFGLTPEPLHIVPICGAVRPTPGWSKAARRGVVRVYVTPHPFFAEQFLRQLAEHNDGIPYLCGRCRGLLLKRAA